jgi:hypothetical protein
VRRLVDSRYDSLLGEALMDIYPEIDWLPWRFESLPKWFWFVEENRRKFFDYLAEQCKIGDLDDWYK